jgi:hypothetical protein
LELVYLYMNYFRSNPKRAPKAAVDLPSSRR